ncbi:MAG: hypothetical protein AAGE52_33365 [Myxococcota bacterium]
MKPVFFLLAFGLLVGCGDGGIGDSCSSDGDCGSNLVCFDWPCVGDRCRQSCEQPCMSSDECSNGRICSGMLCTAVGTPPPSLPDADMVDSGEMSDAAPADDAGESPDASDG